GTMDNAIKSAIEALLDANAIAANTGIAFDNVVRMIYKWRKSGVPFFRNAFEKDVKKVFDRVVRDNVTAGEPIHLRISKTYKKKGTNLLVKKRAPDALVKINDELVTRSRTAFNPAYIYHQAHGARPNQVEKW